MASVWHNAAMHSAVAEGFLKTGQANALDGSQYESRMWRRRAEFTHDADVEFDSGRLVRSYDDVARLVRHRVQRRGPRYDTEYSDEGSDELDEDGSDGGDGGLSDDGDDDHIGGECDIGGEPAVAGGEQARGAGSCCGGRGGGAACTR